MNLNVQTMIKKINKEKFQTVSIQLWDKCILNVWKSLKGWGSCLMGVTSYRIGKGWVDDETDHFGWVGPSWYICSSSWRWCFIHHFKTWSMKKFRWMTELWPNKQTPQKWFHPPLTPNQLFIQGALEQNMIPTPHIPNNSTRHYSVPLSQDAVGVPRCTFSPCSHIH